MFKWRQKKEKIFFSDGVGGGILGNERKPPMKPEIVVGHRA